MLEEKKNETETGIGHTKRSNMGVLLLNILFIVGCQFAKKHSYAVIFSIVFFYFIFKAMKEMENKFYWFIYKHCFLFFLTDADRCLERP